MKLKNVFKISGIFVILMSFAFTSLVQADTYIKRKRHTDSYKVMGKTVPAKDEIIITWMAKDKGRIDTGDDNSMIIRLDKNLIYSLDYTTMSYVEMPIGGISKMFSGAFTEEMEKEEVTEEDKKRAEEIGDFMKDLTSDTMQTKTKITDTGEKKIIRGWKCRKYILEMDTGMGITTSEIWATEDIKIDYNLYAKISNAMMFKEGGWQEDKELKKIKGIEVLSIISTEMMGFKYYMTDEILEVKEKPAPSNIYEIPKGYVKAKQDYQDW